MKKEMSKKSNWDKKTADQKLETFAAMMDKAVLSYPHLIRRSFISGIFTGLGATVGVAILFLVLTLIFTLLGKVPFIGTYSNLINNQLQDLKPGKK